LPNITTRVTGRRIEHGCIEQRGLSSALFDVAHVAFIQEVLADLAYSQLSNDAGALSRHKKGRETATAGDRIVTNAAASFVLTD
jgi:hypothetical protein